MNAVEISKQRLVNQQITGTKIKTAVDLVAWLGAVQGQEYVQAKWGLGLRLPHLVDADIEQDFTDGKILRTHILRPTLHLVTAQDIGWLLMLTAPRVHAANAHMYSKLELSPVMFKQCNDILAKALQGGRQLTRNELRQVLTDQNISIEGQRFYYILMQAELEGIICSGARLGKQFTYALLEERVKQTKKISREEALAELTLRYFRSRGPATIKDYSTWSGLTIADCKKGLSMVATDLNAVKVEDEEFFAPPDCIETAKAEEIYLLPVYDELLIGYKNTRDVTLHRLQAINQKPEIMYDNTIIMGGQIIGFWKRTIKPKAIDLEYEFALPFNASQCELFRHSLKRFGQFHGLEVNVIERSTKESTFFT